MDNNLTGIVAINLTQTGLIPYLNALVAPLSALIGAGAVLFVSWLTQKKDRQKLRRDERKSAYTNFMAAASLMGSNPHPTSASFDFAKYYAEVEIIGSKNVINKIHELNINPNSMWQDSQNIRDNLIPLMREELQ